MSEDEEMSDEELDALISDLESRDGASGEVASGGEMPEEELDNFLQELEEDESSSEAPPTTTEVADDVETDVAPDLSDLEGVDELPAETEESVPSPAEDSDQKAKGTDTEDVPEKASESEKSRESSSESKGWEYAWIGTKWTGFVVPVLALWWLLGAYLGQWVSAGWLIFLISTMFVFGIPKLAYDASNRRGRYRWWLAGIALVLTIGLTAPISGIAGEVLAGYGHWPGTFLTEVFGTDLGIGTLIGRLGEILGTQLAPGLSEAAMQVDLGSAPTN